MNDNLNNNEVNTEISNEVTPAPVEPAPAETLAEQVPVVEPVAPTPEEPKKKGKGGLIIIIILLLALGGFALWYFVLGGNGSKKEEPKKEPEQKEEEKKEEDKEDDKPADSNSDQYIRKTSLVLVEEPECTGNSSSRTATINNDKNIDIVQGNETGVVVVGNAKYIYSVGILACDVHRLYYITEDKELYYIDYPSTSDTNQKGIKATDSKVIEFLGKEYKENDGDYIKVLTEDNEIEYINYYKIQY